MTDLPTGPHGSPPPTAPTAARAALDRLAVERVLARAAELQAASMEQGGMLTEEQILEIGREVGLAPEALRQALAEERTRVLVPPEAGMAARLFGPGSASASRTVPGTPSAVLGRLDAWMQRDECLRPKRRFADRITFEPRNDFLASLRRSFDVGGRGYALARAREVAATVVPVDQGRVLVRLDADLSTSRRARMQVSGVTAGMGVATGGTLAAIAALVVVPGAAAVAAVAALAVLPAAAGIGGAFAVARGHGEVVARTQLALEQMLDRLEHERGLPTPGLTVPLLGRIL